MIHKLTPAVLEEIEGGNKIDHRTNSNRDLVCGFRRDCYWICAVRLGQLRGKPLVSTDLT